MAAKTVTQTLEDAMYGFWEHFRVEPKHILLPYEVFSEVAKETWALHKYDFAYTMPQSNRDLYLHGAKAERFDGLHPIIYAEHETTLFVWTAEHRFHRIITIDQQGDALPADTAWTLLLARERVHPRERATPHVGTAKPAPVEDFYRRPRSRE